MCSERRERAKLRMRLGVEVDVGVIGDDNGEDRGVTVR